MIVNITFYRMFFLIIVHMEMLKKGDRKEKSYIHRTDFDWTLSSLLKNPPILTTNIKFKEGRKSHLQPQTQYGSSVGQCRCRTVLVPSHLQYFHCGCGNHLHCRSQRWCLSSVCCSGPRRCRFHPDRAARLQEDTLLPRQKIFCPSQTFSPVRWDTRPSSFQECCQRTETNVTDSLKAPTKERKHVQ